MTELQKQAKKLLPYIEAMAKGEIVQTRLANSNHWREIQANGMIELWSDFRTIAEIPEYYEGGY